MRRTLVLAVLVLVGGVVAVSPVPAAAEHSAKASVDVVSLDPLRVTGAGFRPYERVRLTVWVDGSRATARVRAGRRGRFGTLVATAAETCRSSVVVRAIGARGSRAELALNELWCAPTS